MNAKDKVYKAFRITASELLDKVDENGGSDYWTNAHSFYCRVKDKEVSQLTPGEESWLEKIERSLE